MLTVTDVGTVRHFEVIHDGFSFVTTSINAVFQYTEMNSYTFHGLGPLA